MKTIPINSKRCPAAAELFPPSRLIPAEWLFSRKENIWLTRQILSQIRLQTPIERSEEKCLQSRAVKSNCRFWMFHIVSGIIFVLSPVGHFWICSFLRRIKDSLETSTEPVQKSIKDVRTCKSSGNTCVEKCREKYNSVRPITFSIFLQLLFKRCPVHTSYRPHKNWEQSKSHEFFLYYFRSYLVHLNYFLDSLLNWNMVVDCVPNNERHNCQTIRTPLMSLYPVAERARWRLNAPLSVQTIRRWNFVWNGHR